MKKIPKSWERVEDSKHEPEYFEYLAPVSQRKREILDLIGPVYTPDGRKYTSYSTTLRWGGRKSLYTREGDVWRRHVKVRNPDYVTPIITATLYGLPVDADKPAGAVYLVYPQDAPDRKLRPAAHRLVMSFGGDPWDAGLDVFGNESGEKDKPVYEWDGKEFKLKTKCLKYRKQKQN